ncbi:DUF5994 family protein [Streptomyces sp. NPDC008222]|uniref:DUF5994 family protein n=1 Tax=Streptomyces sp. NPDC008222 TaxID=3364820 RepID=UPI0036EAF123
MPLPRLTLRPDVSHGLLDGAWWPRCGVLELELPALVGSLDPGFGTVTRVTVDTAAWPDAPRSVMTPGHAIEVALTDGDIGAHAITLDVGPVHRWQLLVVPPAQPLGTAVWLLSAVADPEIRLTAPEMLALAENRESCGRPAAGGRPGQNGPHDRRRMPLRPE